MDLHETDLTQGLDIGKIGVTTGGLYAGDSDDDEDVAAHGDESGGKRIGSGRCLRPAAGHRARPDGAGELLPKGASSRHKEEEKSPT